MALESTQPLTEMSTRNSLGGKGWPALEAGNLIAICEQIVYKMWEPRYLTTLWASQPETGIVLYFIFFLFYLAEYIACPLSFGITN
jgi:hypothetical protein